MGSNLINFLRQQIASMRQSLFAEEILDSQFVNLEQLEDKDTPNFVEEMITLYLSDSPKLIATIEQALGGIPFDFATLNVYLHQLKGSSCSIGANNVTKAVIEALAFCKRGDFEGCKAAVLKLKQDHNILRNRIEPYFKLRQQLRSVETCLGLK